MSTHWILESGSSKTDWVIFDEGRLVAKGVASGFNPYRDDLSHLDSLFETLLAHDSTSPEQLTHYSSGATEEKSPLMREHWQMLTKKSEVNIYSDLMAVAHAADKACWVGILGTGSNLAFFDGQQLINRIPSLGWLLGDEGGSRSIAKSIIRSYCREQFDESLHLELENLLKLNPAETSSLLPYPDQALTLIDKIAGHLQVLQHHVSIKGLIHQNISSFLNLLPSERISGELYLAGSVAHHYQSYIRENQFKKDLEITVIQYPLQRIIERYESGN